MIDPPQSPIDLTDPESSLFLRSILDNLPHMVFVKEAQDLRFIEWNKAAEELVGTPRKDVVGRTDLDLFPDDEATTFRHKDRQVLDERVLHDIPEETLDTWRGRRIIHTKKIPILDEKGTPVFLLGISEDITELKAIKTEAAARLEAAREDERRRIARELHDELGQLLTALKLDLGCLENEIDPALLARTQAMATLIDNTIRTVRRLATQLRPHVLDDLGLKAGLEWLTRESCKRANMTYEVHWTLASREMTKDAESAFFRICQEALNNVIRHAQATHVIVTFSFDRRGLNLKVTDNGQGHTAQLSQPSGLGLLGIQERIGLLGGTLSLQTAKGEGTTLSAWAPASHCFKASSPPCTP